jgi:cytosine/adenosine deaminase-related metal-dependent hydrolase
MSRKIVQGAEIVTMDKAQGDFPAADILIENGAIVAVGPSLDASGAERIDGAGMIALPGIIDAHTCLWQTVARGHVPDLWAGTYGTELLPLRKRYAAEDNYNAAWVGAHEMLSTARRPSSTIATTCARRVTPRRR